LRYPSPRKSILPTVGPSNRRTHVYGSGRRNRRSSGLLLVLALLALATLSAPGCSSSNDGGSTDSPETLGCVDYNQHDSWREARMAGRGPSWFHQAWDVEVVGDLAFVAGGQRGLHVFDVSDTSHPQLLASLALPENRRVTDAAVLGSHAYLAGYDRDGRNFVYVCDISTPREPRLVTKVRTVGARRITLAWPCAYVACQGAGLKILNIMQPGSASVVAELDFFGQVQDIEIRNGYAYAVSSNDHLYVVDVRDSAAPRKINTLEIAGARAIDIAGQYAYTVGTYDSFTVYDLQDPQDPVLVGSAEIAGSDVEVAGSHAYVVSDTYPDRRLVVVDISVVASPSIAATIPLDPGQQSFYTDCKLHLDREMAYVAFTSGGLQIVDVATPTAPRLEARFADMGNPIDVQVRDDLAYVLCDYGGLKVFDLSHSVFSPALIGEVAITGSLRAVQIVDDFAYMAGHSQLTVVDILDPQNLAVSGSIELSTGYDLAVDSGRAYVALGHSGLAIVDVTHAATPHEIGRIDTPGVAVGVALAGNHAYIADDEAAMHVVDITNPSAPELVATLETPEDPRGITISGTTVYMGSTSSDLMIVDISDPEAPTVTGTTNTSHGGGGAVLLSGHLAYTLNYSTLAVYDVANPFNPVRLGYTQIPGANATGNGLAFHGDYLLLATNDHIYNSGIGGLIVAWRQCGDADGVVRETTTGFTAITEP